MKPSTKKNRFIDRELSWLAFNERVLAEGANIRHPILERLKFHSIFTSNLDEFFMKRVGGLKRRNQSVREVLGTTDPEIDKSLDGIRKATLRLLQQQAQNLKSLILPELHNGGVKIVKLESLSETEKEWAKVFFKSNFFSILTPLVVDEGHPFPFISNLSVSLGIWLENPELSGDAIFARIKIPSVFPSWILVPQNSQEEHVRFVSSFEIIENNLELLFPGLKVLSSTSFRVTRNAIVERDEDEEENDDLLEMVSEELKERRFAEAIRLEYSPGADPKLIMLLKQELVLSDQELFELPMAMELYQLNLLTEIKKAHLQFSPWVPVESQSLNQASGNIFDSIRQKDILVHHPFESFHASVERFIKEASQDPDVVAIKMTIYRTGEDSPFIPYLIRAAASGKQVACLVELQARFDEERNILAAQALEKSGVHVVYGIKGLKTHSKLALVVRREGDQMRSYVHIGTGNYHAKTAQLYTDLGFFSARREITEDVINLFHHLTGKSLRWNFEKLLVAPIDMRASLVRMIQREISHVNAGRRGHIVIKINNLEDSDIIQLLYDASRAGVKIDLIVRSICCLKAGVEELSENIRVISIVDRFLEHSRIFFFQNGKDSKEEGEFFIGSSDLMSRNLNDRIEAVTPVEDLELKKQLASILELYWNDTSQAWELKSDGTYTRRANLNPQLSAQETLMAQFQKTRDWQRQLISRETPQPV